MVETYFKERKEALIYIASTLRKLQNKKKKKKKKKNAIFQKIEFISTNAVEVRSSKIRKCSWKTGYA